MEFFAPLRWPADILLDRQPALNSRGLGFESTHLGTALRRIGLHFRRMARYTQTQISPQEGKTCVTIL